MRHLRPDSWRKSVKGRTRRSDSLEGDVLEMASDVRIGGTVRKGRGEAKSDPDSDEDRRPRPHIRSTGLTSTSRTAGCGPACPVVWEGRGRKSSPYPVCANWRLVLPRCYVFRVRGRVWFGRGSLIAPGPSGLLQQLGHFLLHAVGLRQRRDARLAQDFVLRHV
jgi:hypothetical protein